MDDTSKSILLQVAFKGAIDLNEPTSTKVQSFYELLLDLHEKNDINPKPRGGGGFKGGGSSKPAAPKPSGEIFTYQNILVEDFRDLKKDGTVKANYPDFKTVNGDVIEGITTDRGAAWLSDQNNEPNENVKPLVEAADTKVFG